MIVFDEISQCYMRKGYDPVPRSEVVDAIENGIFYDNRYLNIYNSLKGRGHLVFDYYFFVDAVNKHSNLIYVLLAYSEFHFEYVKNYVNDTFHYLHCLVRNIMISKNPGSLIRILFMIGFGERFYVEKNFQISGDGMINYQYHRSLPPTTQILYQCLCTILGNFCPPNPHGIVSIVEELLRFGLSIDIYFKGSPLCCLMYRYIIFIDDEKYQSWRYNDNPHPHIKDSTKVSTDFAYFFAKKLNEVKNDNTMKKLSGDAKINKIFKEAREEYIQRPLFEKLYSHINST